MTDQRHQQEIPLARPGWHRIFVYGTLKRDQVNYPYWMPKSGESIFQGDGTTVHKFPLFVNSKEFGSSPCMMDAKDLYLEKSHRVVGEVYDVSPKHLEELNTLEGTTIGIYTVGSVSVEWTKKNMSATAAATHTSSTSSAEMPMLSDCGVYFRTKRIPEDWATSRPFINNFQVSKAVEDPEYTYIVPQLQKGHHLENAKLTFPIKAPPVMALLIIDGIGDTTYKKLLDGKTPLQSLRAQRKKKDSSSTSSMMDKVASLGVNGLMDSVCPGESCGSDTAHLSLFGYDPLRYYEGRGAFEALGAGMEMNSGDIAFKSNFATLGGDSGNNVVARRCDRNFEEEGPILCAHLDGLQVRPFNNDDGGEHDTEADSVYTVHVKYATEHRCGVVISGPGLNAAISGTDPLKDGCALRQCTPIAQDDTKNDASAASRAARRTCVVIDAVSQAIQARLVDHPINADRIKQGKNPANVVLLRGAAMKSECPPMVMRHGLRSFMVAPTCIISGLGKTLGMDIVTAPGATGDYHSDLTSKATTFLETLKSGEYDFGVLHIKSVDDAGHDKDPQLKLNLLEKVDKMLEEVLWPGLPLEATLAITGDHSTSCHFGDHTCEPVPVTIATKLSEGQQQGVDHWVDQVSAFDEVACSQSDFAGLGRFNGIQLMDIMKRYHRHRFVLEQ